MHNCVLVMHGKLASAKNYQGIFIFGAIHENLSCKNFPLYMVYLCIENDIVTIGGKCNIPSKRKGHHAYIGYSTKD